MSFKIIFAFVISFIIFASFIGAADAAIVQRGSTNTYNDTASTTDVTLTKPTGVVAGDFLVIFTCDDNGSTTVSTGPSGFTQAGTLLSTTTIDCYTYYKVAGSSEPSSYTVTWSTSNATKIGIIAAFYSDAGGVLSYDTVSENLFALNTTHTIDELSTATTNEMLVAMFASDDCTAACYSGYTSPLVEIGDVGRSSLAVAMAIGIQSSSGASGTKTASVSLSDGQGKMIAIREIPPTPTPTPTLPPQQELSNFADAFTDSNGKLLQYHSPTTGTGWLRLLTDGGGDETLEIQSNQLVDSTTCSANEGVLYRTNDTFTYPNYEVSVTAVTADNTDDTNTLAARIQDVNNMYIVVFNNDDSGIYKRTAGSWSSELADGPGIANGSVVKLVVDGDQISFVDDGATIIGPITDTSITNAGYAGVGIGATVNTNDDCESQVLDNFDVTVIPPWPRGVTVSSVTDNTYGFRATFNGSANPNGYATTTHFRVFTSNPGNCNSDSGGIRFPLLAGNNVAIGSGSTSQNFSYTIPLDSGVFLEPNTSYWVCSYATNTYGTVGSSSVVTFTTPDGQSHPCDPPSSGNLTIPSGAACTFNGTYDGVDAGSGTTNTASLILEPGVQMTVNSGQRIGRGTFTVRNGASLSLAHGASIVRGGVYVHDKDADGFLDSKTTYVGSTASAETEFVRRNAIATNYNYSGKIASSGATLDCDPNNASYWRYQMAYVDSDGDGYGGTAASVGPNNPSANTTNTTVGTATWSNGGNTYTSNGSYATASVTSTTITEYLRLRNFGFSIPNGATITGVTVEIERHANGSGVSDYSIRLYNGGYTNGVNKASASAWATSDPNSYVTYGGNGDTWGIPLTEANVESSNFGVILAVQSTASRTVSVDHVRVTVHYSSGTLESVCSGSAYPAGYALNNNDCSPADANLYQTDATLYTDGDKDGIVGATQYTVCKGAANPSGWQASSGSDCSDASRGRTTNRTCYADADNDTYTPSSTGSYCVGSSCTATIDGQASGYYTSASSPVDCYDSNSSARPGQTSYFGTNRGDGSFDYDCDGSSTKQTETVCTSQTSLVSSWIVIGSCQSNTITRCDSSSNQTPFAACGTDFTSAQSGHYSDSGCSTPIMAAFTGTVVCR